MGGMVFLIVNEIFCVVVYMYWGLLVVRLDVGCEGELVVEVDWEIEFVNNIVMVVVFGNKVVMILVYN